MGAMYFGAVIVGICYYCNGDDHDNHAIYRCYNIISYRSYTGNCVESKAIELSSTWLKYSIENEDFPAGLSS